MASTQNNLHVETSTTLTPATPSTLQVSYYIPGNKAVVQHLVTGLAHSTFIVPTYTKRGVFSDWQVLISGKAKTTESPAQAAQRELAEEVGFIFDLATIGAPIYTERTKHNTVHYFHVKLEREVAPGASTNAPIRADCLRRGALADNKAVRVCIFLTCVDITASTPSILRRARVSSTDSAGHTIMTVSKTELLAGIGRM